MLQMNGETSMERVESVRVHTVFGAGRRCRRKAIVFRLECGKFLPQRPMLRQVIVHAQ